MRNTPVEIYHAEFSDPFLVGKKYHTGLFSFKQIADNFDIIIRKWIAIEVERIIIHDGFAYFPIVD